MSKKRIRGNPLPLIIEKHPQSYTGYPFITLIQYRNQNILGIVDNADDKNINAYILDYCGPEKINEEEIIKVAIEWYEKSKNNYPISVEFSKRGMAPIVKSIYRSFSTAYVTRVIGPLPKFEMEEVISIKRKRKKQIPKNININNNLIKL